MATRPFAAAPDPQTREVKDMHESTVTMLFPKRVMLTLKDYSRIIFEPGPREVPLSLVDNQYLADNGVTTYKPAKKIEMNPRLTELAQDLWEAGELLNFAQYIGDGHALSSQFEAARLAKQKEVDELIKTHGSESYAEMQARVERERILRPPGLVTEQQNTAQGTEPVQANAQDDEPANPTSDPPAPVPQEQVEKNKARARGK